MRRQVGFREGRGVLTCLQRWRFWGGPNRVLSEASSLNPRPLKGIQSKGSSLNAGHTVGASPVADIGFTRIQSRIKHLGPCFGTNGHSRRDPDTISRLPDTTTQDLSVFIGFRHLGPCFGMNGHSRRDPDKILFCSGDHSRPF